MKIGIVGGGVVGRATAKTYSPYHDVRVWDVAPERCTHTVGEVWASDLVFVCVPEYAVEAALRSRATLDREVCIVIKSTTGIGWTREFSTTLNLPNVVHSPEFLTERTALIDALIPSRLIIGSPNEHLTNTASYKLFNLYRDRFLHTVPHMMTSDESEAVKLFTNAFFATKVAYFNEIKTLSDSLGLNWQNVLEGILNDGRIAHSHTDVPGHDGRTGFGGKCLPKDLNQLISHFIMITGADVSTNNVAAHVLCAVNRRNRDIDRREEES